MTSPFRRLRSLFPHATPEPDNAPPVQPQAPLTANLFIVGPPRVGKTALFTVLRDSQLPNDSFTSTDVGVDVILSGANHGFLYRYNQEWEKHVSSDPAAERKELLPTGPSASLEQVRLQPGWPVEFDAHDMPDAILPSRVGGTGAGNPDAGSGTEAAAPCDSPLVIDPQRQTFALSSWVMGCYSNFPERREIDRRDITVLVCFDISSYSSFRKVMSQWNPSNLSSQVPLFDGETWSTQSRKTGAKVRFWLVGCKSDLRLPSNDRVCPEENSEPEPLVTFMDCQISAFAAGFKGYLECSAREPTSVYTVLKDAAVEQRRQIAKRWGVPEYRLGSGDGDHQTTFAASWRQALRESRRLKKDQAEILLGSWDYCNWIKYP